MKIVNYFILFLILFLGQSCSKMIVLTNKTFVDNDTIRMNSIQFMNDSVCIYVQKFLCDIDERYKETKIISHYEIIKKKIILKNLTLNPDSLNTPCYRLPESEIKKCHFFNDPPLKSKFILAGAPGSFSKADVYGYINNITTDTLYYKKGTILYTKWYNCNRYPIYLPTLFYEKK
jgi:hypothetical protein